MPDTFSSTASPSPGVETLAESSAKAASPSPPAPSAAASAAPPPTLPSPEPEPEPDREVAPDSRRRFARALGSNTLKSGVSPQLRSRMLAGVIAVIAAGAIALGIGVVVKPAKSAADGASVTANAESGTFQTGKAYKPAHFVAPDQGTAPAPASASAAGSQSAAPVAASKPGQRFSIVAAHSSATAFALSGSGTILYATQGAGPGGWSAFRTMPGSPKTAVSAPVAVADADGHQEAFVRLADGQIADGWQAGHSWQWDGAVTGGAMPGTAVGDPGAVRMYNDSVALVTRLRDGAVALTAQKLPNGTTGWGGWVVIGGDLASDPVPFTDANGNLDIFGISTAGALVLDQWDGTSWTGWHTLGSDGPTDLAYDPTPASNASGSTEVFVTTTAGTVDHVWLTSSGWVWGVPLAPNTLGVTLVDTVGAAAAPDGPIEVYTRLANGGVAHIWQNTPNAATGWSGWTSLPGSLTGAPTAYVDSHGHVELLALGSPDHAVNEYWNGSRWSGPVGVPGAF